MRSTTYILMAFILGWLIAQVTKLVIALIQKKGKIKLEEILHWMVRSGGMPSGHTASFTAMAATMGAIYGFDSPVVVLAACVAVIIIYDAVNVRYAVGEQAKVMNEMIRKDRDLAGKVRKVKIVEGHTVPQVMVGLVLGLVVALMMGWLYWQS